MLVRFRATLADGRVFEGPIQGNCGLLGNGALYLGKNAANREAVRTLARATSFAAQGRSLDIFEPSSGHVAMYPEFTNKTNGPRVEVPLIGTKFEII